MSPNQEDIIVQHDTSEYKDHREFQRYIMIHTEPGVPYMRGLVEDVTDPVREKYAIWGKIRTHRRWEVERIAGVFDDGRLVFEFKMPTGSRVPQIDDFVEAHGVHGRQPKQRFLVRSILPQTSHTIGRCEITPVGNRDIEGDT